MASKLCQCRHGLGLTRNRRTFLVSGSAALGCVAASGAIRSPTAQTRDSTRRIDVHHHLAQPKFVADVAANRLGAQPQPWSPEVSLAEMDKAGIETSIVSIVQPGTWFRGDADKTSAITREINEYGAGMVRDHPGKFGLWASIPLPETELALQEVAYALDVLDADGISLMTSYAEKYPGDPVFAPVFQELNRRRAVIYVHPQTPAAAATSATPCRSRQTDTTRAIGSVLFSGTPARYPDIRWIWSHSGGTVPMIRSASSHRNGHSENCSRSERLLAGATSAH